MFMIGKVLALLFAFLTCVPLADAAADEAFFESVASMGFASTYFLTRLAETKDLGGKPLLGSTMALFGSGMCYGHSHGNANLPLVLAGGSDLGLKHGSHLDFNKDAKSFHGYALGADGALTSAHYQLCSRPVNTDAHMSNLLLLMAQRMGVETDKFGDSNTGIEL